MFHHISLKGLIRFCFNIDEMLNDLSKYHGYKEAH